MIKVNSPGDFAKEFLERYLHNGFGMMNKGELETLIFYLLRKDESFRKMSIFDLSRTLQISETKVRKLIYDSDLRYGKTDDEYVINEFFKYLKQGKFQSESNKIMFPIDNKVVRSAIDDKLRSLGYFSDTSFNRDVFAIQIDAFIELINDYYTEDVKDEILDKCKECIKNDNKEKITFKMILKEFLLGASHKAGELSVSALFAALSGGFSVADGLIKEIKQILN